MVLHSSMLTCVFLALWCRAHEDRRRRQNGQHKLDFSMMLWKHELQVVWLQGNVTGLIKMSIQILHWTSDSEGMASLCPAIWM